MLRFGSGGVKRFCHHPVRISSKLVAKREHTAASHAAKPGNTQVEQTFSVFPRIEDVKPQDFLGYENYGFGTYFVGRSAAGNLPVYTDFKAGGNKIVTEIRKIDGDIIQLRNDMQEELPHIPKQLWKVLIQSKKIVIKGDFVRDVKNILRQRF